MENDQLTPPPWRWKFVSNAGNYFLLGNNGKGPITANSPLSADGRLKQAAPALLAACEMAIEAATVYDTDEFTPGQIAIRQAAKEAGVKPMEYVMKAIRAAVAEARGSDN